LVADIPSGATFLEVVLGNFGQTQGAIQFAGRPAVRRRK
jgi:hypothetical protein